MRNASSLAPAGVAVTASRDQARIATDTARIARAAIRALYDELALYPKPGLVSFVDDGSHDDMNARTFLRSIGALRDYFVAITALGAAGAPFAELERLGIAAERRMLCATGGVNTHRGAIFTLGLLCAAAGCAANEIGVLSAESLRACLLARWGDALDARLRRIPGSVRLGGSGEPLGGAAEEAANGLPVLFEVAMPTLRRALCDGMSSRRARLQTFFAVMAALDDTNLVRRGGIQGLRFAQRSALGFLAASDTSDADAIARAESVHRAFVARRLSPGGVADVLAAACWTVRICG
jgi:triphosphoribosyl-dephospho-CoA synthase